jgi:RNA polymerase sigma-70 factor (ECF subfamily)
VGEAAQVADRSAETPDLEAIYLAEVSYVWNFLRFVGVPERDLEDVVHEVFIVVHKQLGHYDPSRPLRPWLTGIAFRVASDHRRLARHRREIPCEVLGDVDKGPTPESKLAHKQEMDQVMQALDCLEPDRRAVFVLHDLHEYSMPEIATIIDAPLNTLYSRLRLARAEFNKVIKRLRRGAP